MATKILGIGGSPRKGGNSDALLAAILAGAAKEGAETEALHVRDYTVQPCIGCERCRKDKVCTGLLDGMQLIYPKIEAAQGLVLVSPTHNYNVSAIIKAFIDRLYQYYDFTNDHPRAYSSRLAGQGRKAAVCAVCEQVDRSEMGPTLEMLRRPLEPLGYRITGELPVYGVFHKGKVKEQAEAMAQAEKLGMDLVWALGQDFSSL